MTKQERVKLKLSSLSFKPYVVYKWGFIPVIVSENEYNYFLENKKDNGFGRIVPKDSCVILEFPFLYTEDEVVNCLNKTIADFYELNITSFDIGDYSDGIKIIDDVSNCSKHFDLDLMLRCDEECKMFMEQM